MRLDFLARQVYYIDHLAPIWNFMEDGQRGVFYLPDDCVKYAKKKIKNLDVAPYIDEGDCGDQPILTCSYGDAVRAADWNLSRPVILMEHGIGLTFGKAGYADGFGQRVKMAMFPVPSFYVQRKAAAELRDKPHPVVGMPKLDPWAGEFNKPHPMPAKPVIGLAFHHGDHNSRPGVVGSAWEHYAEILPELVKTYKVLLHLHPMSAPLVNELKATLLAAGAEYVDDFNDIMRRADIYINDSSSTLYEFCVTGKPVIILNAPWFDRTQDWGIRFWDYADVGPQVNEPAELLPAVEVIAKAPDTFRPQRSRAVSDLLPFLGQSSSKAVAEIETFLSQTKRQFPFRSVSSPQIIQEPKQESKGKAMSRFFIAKNMDSDDMFHEALVAAGYMEVDHPSLADFIVHDAVHPGLEKYIDSHPVFLTPHTPQSSFLWDGILDPSPVCCNFVYGEAGVNCLKAYGYPYRAEAVGFGRCGVRQFRPTRGRDLLIVPAHPSRRGQDTNPAYMDWAMSMLKKVMAARSEFGKVTLCWSETNIDTNIAREMELRQVEHIIANPWTDPQPLQHMIERIEAADLVMSCNTTGCVAVARGRPTIFFTEREAPRSTPKSTLHPEKYHHFLKFPLQAEEMSIPQILAVREKSNEQVEYWKEQNIGGNFNAQKFVGVIREFIK